MSKKTINKEAKSNVTATKQENEKSIKVSQMVEQKKITTEAEKKRISAKPEAVKLTTQKEPKKLSTRPQPKKISAKPEPKRITEKKKDKKEPAKAAVKKQETSSVKKIKTTPVKKQAVPKKKKVSAYIGWDMDECIKNMQKMGVNYTYEDYFLILLEDADMKRIEKNIIEGNKLKEKGYTLKEHGCDLDLVAMTLMKVADSMDVKALDFKSIQKDIKAFIKFKFKEDATEENSVEYLKQFKVCEKILMIGQRKHMTSAADVSKLLNVDIETYIDRFFAFAYQLLPTWKYDDVKFYEDFAYAMLSQYGDLYELYQLRLLIDCADLYIKQGDFQHGDENYGYILRDNQIKDYIYYRFASVYENIDLYKAKALAHESLEYVDDRYEYYQNIMEIIHKPEA